MPAPVFLTGASGAGKSTLAAALARDPEFSAWRFAAFDHIIGEPAFAFTPSEAPDAWQRRATLEWCRRLAALGPGPLLLDGQTRWSYVEEGCRLAGLPPGRVVLVDCEWQERVERLEARGHPELANESMQYWAQWLRAEAVARGSPVLDSSGRSPAESAQGLKRILLAL